MGLRRSEMRRVDYDVGDVGLCRRSGALNPGKFADCQRPQSRARLKPETMTAAFAFSPTHDFFDHKGIQPHPGHVGHVAQPVDTVRKSRYSDNQIHEENEHNRDGSFAQFC
jgi:hypothetical protein